MVKHQWLLRENFPGLRANGPNFGLPMAFYDVTTRYFVNFLINSVAIESRQESWIEVDFNSNFVTSKFVNDNISRCGQYGCNWSALAPLDALNWIESVNPNSYVLVFWNAMSIVNQYPNKSKDINSQSVAKNIDNMPWHYSSSILESPTL